MKVSVAAIEGNVLELNIEIYTHHSGSWVPCVDPILPIAGGMRFAALFEEHTYEAHDTVDPE